MFIFSSLTLPRPLSCFVTAELADVPEIDTIEKLICSVRSSDGGKRGTSAVNVHTAQRYHFSRNISLFASCHNRGVPCHSSIRNYWDFYTLRSGDRSQLRRDLHCGLRKPQSFALRQSQHPKSFLSPHHGFWSIFSRRNFNE